MNDLEQILKNVISGNETKVYLFLLKIEKSSAKEISDHIGMDRTLVYQVIYNLIEKGLVATTYFNNKKLFFALDPENLLNDIRTKEKNLTAILPELKKFKEDNIESPKYALLEGKNGLRTFLEELMKSKDVCVIGATGRSFEFLKYELPHLVKDAAIRGLKGKMIISPDNKDNELLKLKNFKTRFLKEIDSSSTTTIYDDAVAIHVFSEKPSIIIMKDKRIYSSYKSYFEILWKKTTKK